eukprot:CAMPEP_0201891560 /NCGR_PEP_ID=MMETSP0902-20130614/34704_1 /ASSEMBLY_ACC=CAM_ASM_000551 /TAXON_ID=420261 /ORGANISM="Thalassiosira antarctica, Strain CCMP982" /LENGTH=44 /DNA_ID= /DNA_START= /DNA_END= /DNA_ORIENTATION=
MSSVSLNQDDTKRTAVVWYDCIELSDDDEFWVGIMDLKEILSAA